MSEQIRNQEYARPERLEAEPIDIQTTRKTPRTIHGRSVCVLQECTASDIFQLETRSPSYRSGCSDPDLGSSPPTSLSSLCTARQSITEDKGGNRSLYSSGGTPVASTTMVCTPSQHGGVSASDTSNVSPDPSESSTPSGDTGPPEVSRLACVRRGFKDQGISGAAADIICASWRQGTNKSNWKRWASWCGERQVDPSTAPLGEILNFLTESFQSGKQ